MSVKLKKETDKQNRLTLIAMLSGDIDHHSAVEIRECVDSAVKLLKPACLILDFSEITFMDSSGVGLVMGRYKLMSFFGGTVILRNVSERYERIFKLSGIEKIATFEKRSEAV